MRLISDDASIKAGLLTRQSVSRRNGGYRRSHLSFILDQIGIGEKKRKMTVSLTVDDNYQSAGVLALFPVKFFACVCKMVAS